MLTPFCNETEWEEKVKALSRAEALEEGEVEEETTATSVAAKTLCIPMDQVNPFVEHADDGDSRNLPFPFIPGALFVWKSG